MKYLFIFLFAAFSLTASAQNTNPEVNRLMEQELKMIQKDLASNALSVEQTAELQELLAVKAEKIYAVREGDMGKLEMSQSLTKINNEFDPAVLEIFTVEQKKIFKASTRNKRKYSKKN